jgi:hypothetical protein
MCLLGDGVLGKHLRFYGMVDGAVNVGFCVGYISILILLANCDHRLKPRPVVTRCLGKPV